MSIFPKQDLGQGLGAICFIMEKADGVRGELDRERREPQGHILGVQA